MVNRIVPSVTILLVLLAACSSGPPPVPDDYQRLQHPLGSIAVPEDWRVPDEPGRGDPDAVRAILPQRDLERPLGVRLYEATAQNPPFRAADEAILLEVAEMRTQISLDQVTREPFEVPGSDNAILLQYAIPNPETGEPLKLTYLGALTNQGSVLVASFIGTADQIPDEVIEAARETFHVKGGS